MVRRCCHAVAARAASVSLSSGGLALPQVQPRSEALPKEKRLAKRREFLHVYETGRKLFSRYCVIFASDNNLPFSRLGITRGEFYRVQAEFIASQLPFQLRSVGLGCIRVVSHSVDVAPLT